MKSSQTNFQAVSSIKSTQKCTDILGPPTAQVVLLSHSTRPLPGPEHPLTEPGPSRVLSAPLTEPGTSGVLSAPSLNQGPSRVLSAPSLNQAPPGSGHPLTEPGPSRVWAPLPRSSGRGGSSAGNRSQSLPGSSGTSSTARGTGCRGRSEWRSQTGL